MLEQVWHQQLSPLDFLERSRWVYPDKTAVVHGDHRYTYRQLYDRVDQLAGALEQAGAQPGDRVAVLLPNVPPMLEAHFAPLRLGAVLVPLNIRLSPREVAYMLNHSEAKVLLFDSEFAPTVRALQGEVPTVETFVQVVDAAPRADDLPGPEYEAFITAGPRGNAPVPLASEDATISINYTSGTTG